MASICHAVALEARSSGHRRLSVTALRMSHMGLTLKQYGFLPQRGENPIVVRALTEGVKLPTPDAWLLAGIDGESL